MINKRGSRLIGMLILVVLVFTSCKSQVLPEGYSLVYSQEFAAAEGVNNDFEMSDNSAWRWSKSGQCLELYGESEYRARVRSPFNIAMIKDLAVGDFILELDAAQTGKEYGHRDLCFFFNMKDPTNFYYVHIASVADDNANNIFIVNDEPRTKIATKTTKGTDWGATGSWHKVRIERVVKSGSIKIFFDDMTTPIMEATDTHFDYGLIGVGSFDDTGMYDNLKVWAPEIINPPTGIFK